MPIRDPEELQRIILNLKAAKKDIQRLYDSEKAGWKEQNYPSEDVSDACEDFEDIMDDLNDVIEDLNDFNT